MYSRLTEDDKALADSKRANAIKWKPYKYSAEGSPLVGAAKYCIAHFGDTFGGSTVDSLRKTALKWFVACYNEGRLEDCKRQRTVDLEEEDWQFLRDVLVADKYRYTDASKNKRRFPTLAAAQFHWKEANTPQAAASLERLEALSSRAGVNLLVLTQRVRARFNLTVRREKFKPKRDTITNRATCERLLGHTPMVEVLTTGRKPVTPKGNLRSVPKSKYIHYRTKLTPYLAAEKMREYDYGKLCLDEGAAHITAAIDGCSIFASGDIRFDANSVHYDVRLPCMSACQAGDVHELSTLHSTLDVVILITQTVRLLSSALSL